MSIDNIADKAPKPESKKITIIQYPMCDRYKHHSGWSKQPELMENVLNAYYTTRQEYCTDCKAGDS